MDPGQMTPRPQSSSSTLRMSTLYEYHNAPEVATAHGLEYDDTSYPSSDKYPVIHQRSVPASYTGKHAYDTSTKPPRIIFGMKVRTFVVVAILFVCIIVGASVGGAVGGKNMEGGNTANQPQQTTSTTSVATATTSQAAAASSSSSTSSSTSTITTSATATPTYTPQSDCPGSNNTSYLSTYSQYNSTADMSFTKHCGVSSPLSIDALSVKNITSAYVYTFDDCTEICASYNQYDSGTNCTVAVYKASAGRPANCWLAFVDLNNATSLTPLKGTAVAILDS